jgi:hypothetical protein
LAHEDDTDDDEEDGAAASFEKDQTSEYGATLGAYDVDDDDDDDEGGGGVGRKSLGVSLGMFGFARFAPLLGLPLAGSSSSRSTSFASRLPVTQISFVDLYRVNAQASP